MNKLQYTFLIFCIALISACSPKSDNKNKADTLPNSDSIPKTECAVTITDGKPMVIDFSASWCPPCQQLKPIYAKLTEEYQNEITMVTVDVDENKEMAEKFDVQAIPTLIFFNKEGKIIDRTTGFIPEQDLRSKLEAMK